MLPGQTYTPDFIIRILLRRKWLVIIPCVLCASAAVAVARRLPNQFRSDTVIVVVPARIPDSYVKSTTTEKLSERLPIIKLEIMSRPRLEQNHQRSGLTQQRAASNGAHGGRRTRDAERH